jgi:trypsin
MNKIFWNFAFLTISSFSFARVPIIGGKNVPDGDAKGVLNIFTTDEAGDISNSCTASKIGAKFILTAAHCVYGKNVNSIAWSNSGSVDLGDENATLYGLYVKKVNIHPSYELFKMLGKSFGANDIAILEVDTTKGNFLNRFQEIPSLKLDFIPVMSGETLQTYGYGCEAVNDLDNPISHKKISDIASLAYSSLNTSCSSLDPLINQNAPAIYKTQIVSSSLASGGKSSLCEGDSGGPVLRNGKVVGVNSQSIIDQTSQAQEAYLNLHSRLSEVKNWVESIII